jgi:hypothetical protein
MLSLLQARFTLNQQHLVCTCAASFYLKREKKETSWKKEKKCC